MPAMPSVGLPRPSSPMVRSRRRHRSTCGRVGSLDGTFLSALNGKI